MLKNILLTGQSDESYTKEQVYTNYGSYVFTVPNGVRKIMALVIGHGAVHSGVVGGKGGGVISGTFQVTEGESISVDFDRTISRVTYGGVPKMTAFPGSTTIRGGTAFDASVDIITNYNATNLPTANDPMAGCVTWKDMALGNWWMLKEWLKVFPILAHPGKAYGPDRYVSGVAAGLITSAVGAGSAGPSDGEGGTGFGGSGGHSLGAQANEYITAGSGGPSLIWGRIEGGYGGYGKNNKYRIDCSGGGGAGGPFGGYGGRAGFFVYAYTDVYHACGNGGNGGFGGNGGDGGTSVNTANFNNGAGGDAGPGAIVLFYS